MKVTPEQLPGLVTRQGKERWERELAAQCRQAGFSVNPQIHGLIPGRRFVFDLRVSCAARRKDVLVEVQGGIHSTVGFGKKRRASPSGHNTAAGISRDYEKLNLAQIRGYRCLLVTSEHVRTGQALKWIEESLR